LHLELSNNSEVVPVKNTFYVLQQVLESKIAGMYENKCLESIFMLKVQLSK